jgi:hypothetical protein
MIAVLLTAAWFLLGVLVGAAGVLAYIARVFDPHGGDK